RLALGTQHSPRWRLVLPIAAAAVALGVTAAALLMRGRSPPLDPRRLVVIPLTNRTRDTALNELGRVAADWIALGMAHEDAFDVVPVSSVSTFVQTFGGDRDTTRALAEFTGSATAISGAYDRFRDTIWFRLEVTDVRADRRLYAL